MCSVVVVEGSSLYQISDCFILFLNLLFIFFTFLTKYLSLPSIYETSFYKSRSASYFVSSPKNPTLAIKSPSLALNILNDLIMHGHQGYPWIFPHTSSSLSNSFSSSFILVVGDFFCFLLILFVAAVVVVVAVMVDNVFVVVDFMGMF